MIRNEGANPEWATCLLSHGLCNVKQRAETLKLEKKELNI